MHPQRYYVYVIRSKKGLYYVGQTEDLDKRLLQHNSGLSKWTKRDIEWKIIHSESYATRKEAIIREKYLKSGRGRQWLKQKFSPGS